MVSGDESTLRRAPSTPRAHGGQDHSLRRRRCRQAAKVCNNMVLAVQHRYRSPKATCWPKLGLSAQSLFASSPARPAVLGGAPIARCRARCLLTGQQRLQARVFDRVDEQDLGLAMDAVAATVRLACWAAAADIYAKSPPTTPTWTSARYPPCARERTQRPFRTKWALMRLLSPSTGTPISPRRLSGPTAPAETETRPLRVPAQRLVAPLVGYGSVKSFVGRASDTAAISMPHQCLLSSTPVLIGMMWMTQSPL